MNRISFPKLGFDFNVNPVAFYIGTKEVYWYALIILTGFLLAVLFCMRSGKKRGLNTDHIFDIGFYGLIVGIICARIYYVLFDLESFNSFWDVFKIWEGGLAIYGGIFGGVLTAFVYCRIKKLNIYEIFDIASPGLMIGQAIGRYGNFFNAEVYGRETDFILGMSINGGVPVHPLFFYESVWNLLGLLLTVLFRDRKTAHGQVFYGYLLWYSCGRLVLEGMRQPEYILYAVDNVIGISQIVAAVLIVFSAIMLVRITGKRNRNEA